MENELEVIEPCPMCNAENGPMGSLGLLMWFRCAQCGMEYNKEKRNESESAHSVQ